MLHFHPLQKYGYPFGGSELHHTWSFVQMIPVLFYCCANATRKCVEWGKKMSERTTVFANQTKWVRISVYCEIANFDCSILGVFIGRAVGWVCLQRRSKIFLVHASRVNVATNKTLFWQKNFCTLYHKKTSMLGRR